MIKKEVFTGFFIGIIVAALGSILCSFIIAQFYKTSIPTIFTSFKNNDKLWMLLSLGAIPNLLLFFWFLNRDLEYRARGIVLATLTVAFITYALYFL